MAGLNTYPYSNLEVGMAIAREPRSATQAMGLGGLAPTTADIAGLREQSLSSMYQMGQEAIAELRQPPAPQNAIAYSPSTQKYWVNNALVDATSPMELAQSGSLFNQPARPAPAEIAADWQPTSKEAIAQRVANLRQPRGVLANIGLGLTSDLPETTIGGLGRTLELAGATELGPAIAGVAERAFGQSKAEQERDALIRQSNSIWSNLTDAIARGAPSTIPAVLAGIGGFAVGGPVGAGLAAAATIFPQELKGFYDSAVKNGYNVNDPAVQADMLKSATGTTVLQSLMPAMAGKGFSQFFRNAAQQAGEQAAATALTRTARVGAVAGEAAKEGLTEGVAEAVSQLAQSAVFDPEFRRQLNASDIKALAPYVVEKYGEDALLAFGAGAFLGAGFGGAAKYIETRPVDLTQRQEPTAEAAPAEAPRLPSFAARGTQYELPLTGGRTGLRREPLTLRPEEPPVGVSPDQSELPIPAQLAFQFPSAVRPTAPAAPAAPAAPTAPTVDTTGLPLFEQPASFPQAPVETQGPVQPTSFLYGPPEAQGTLFPGVPQQQVPPGMQSLLRGAAAPAPEMSPVEAFRAAGDAGQRVMFPYFWPTPTEAERAAAQDRAGYGVTPEYQGPMAPALQRLLRDQAFTKAEAQRAAQMEGQPTAAEAAATAMQAQVAETMPTVFDTEAAVTGTNKIQDDARRRIVNILNALTAEQQTRVLDKVFDNDINKFYADVRASNASKQADLRKQMAQAAGVDESVFKRVKATPTPQEQANAAQAGQVKQGGVSQRPRDGGQVADEGVDRNVPTQDQKGGGEAGGGNRPVEGGQEPQDVAAIKAKAQAEWDQFFDDKGVGYTALTPERQAEWDQLVQRGGITQVEADAFAQPTSPPAVKEAAPSRPLGEAAEAAPVEEEKAPTLSVETPFGAGTVLTEADKAIENNALQAELKAAQTAFDEADRLVKAGERSGVSKTERLALINERFKARKRLEAAERQSGRYSLADWNTITGARNADGTPVRPMPLLRVQQAVSKFLSGLAIRPRVGIYRNQADLKSRNPALYAQAVAAREAGDFDSANAAGYSFGDGNVIIFTDRIANQSHLNFVLAHETLGHFGMRGIMPGPKFDALMTSLYDTNLTLRNAVDVAMDERGLSKAEAVEEYLADYAAVLETSLISKIWNAVKGFLSKVGIKFGDESMRYFLDQSRRYVRQGREGVMFDAAEVASQLQAVENGASGNGRFTLDGLRSDQRKIGDTVHTLLPTNYFDLANNLEGVQAAGLTTLDKLNQFADKFLRMANYTAMNNPAAAAYDLQQTKIGDRRRELQDIYDRRLTALLNDPKAADISMAMVDARLITDMRASKRPPAKAENLFNIAPDGTITPNKAEVDRLFALGTLTKDEFTKGVTETREVELSDGKKTIITNKFEGRDAALYDKYIAAMRAKTDIELDYAKATLENAFRTGEDIKDGIARLRKSKTMAPEDVKFVDATLKTYRDLQKVGLEKVLGGESISAITEASNRAEDFVAKVNEAILAKGFDTKKTDALREFFAAQPAADAFITQLEAFRTGAAMTDSTKFALQQKIKQIVNSYAAADSAVVAAIDMISGGHVPIIRQGQKEVRVQAFVGNKAVTLAPEYKDTMVYAHFDNIGEAKRTADAINESLAGKTYKVLAYDEARNLVEMDVRLVANSGDVLTTAAADPRFDLNNFLYGLRIAGVQLTPTEQAKLIVTMTASSNPLRRKLQYSQTPGNDRRNGLQALSQHIVRRASAIATRENEAAIQRLLDRDNPNTMELWRGNRSGVIAAKKAVDAAKNPAEREIAQRKLQTALYQYRQTNPTEAARKWDGSEKTAPPPEAVNVSRMNYFYGQVHTANEITMNSRDVLEANFETQKLIGDAKAFTALATMGLNVANGVLNLSGVYTNTMNYLATSNAKTGFGGGFGFGKSLAEITLAFRQVGAKKILSKGFEAAGYFEDLAKNPAGLKEAGLQAHEALFLAQQTRNGVMVPATTSVMLNTALRRSSNPRIQKIADLIMLPFNSTETASRRAAGLAAYRLEYERQRAAGNDADTAAQNASRFAEQAINLTLGNYSNLNRPLAWRQGWPSLLFMFKAWPVTSIQLLANLDRKGQIAMLFSLWCLAGLSGLPMAEDAEDIMDTIAQKLGFTSRGIRVEFASLIDSIFPGMSPLVLRGAVSYALGSNLAPNLSGKFSLGDVIPGTDFLLAGAKTDRILNELAGPVPATVLSSAATAASLLSLPFSDTKTLTDVARESRITILRDAFDAYAYAQNGAIVDKRGYVIAPNATAGDYLFRAMGFYPEAAAKQFEQIKYIQRTSNYQKDTMVAFRERWVKARMVNDTEGMRAVEAAVEDWNAETRGTALELRGFRSKAEKLFREATRSSKERALKAAPKGSRKELETMTDLLVAD